MAKETRSYGLGALSFGQFPSDRQKSLGSPKGKEDITPFVQSLRDLASYRGLENRFLSGIMEYSAGKTIDPEMRLLIDLGTAYHGRGLRKALEGKTKEDGIAVKITIPTVVKGENGKMRVVPGVSNPTVPGTVFGIIGARCNSEGQIVFDGVAIVADAVVNRTNSVMVGINSQNGQVFFHPEFIPGKSHKKKVDHVIPPASAHKLFPKGRNLQPGMTPEQFFK